MFDQSRFQELLSRLRAGDDGAVSDLLAEYEPAIRRMIRTRLRNLSLQRVVGEEDVCQSVLKSFFLRYRLGQYDLESPEQLRGLLAQMARNKLNDQHRHHLAQRRDISRAGAQAPDNMIPSPEETPSLKLSNQELLEAALRRMTPEEREIRELVVDQRMNWPDIAATLGGTPEGRRKQWERVRDRVAEEMGL